MRMKTRPENRQPTEEQIMRYIMDHTNEDFPMDQTLKQFYEKVLAYDKIVGEKE